MDGGNEHRPTNVPLMRALAGEFADAYIRSFLIEPVARALRIEASIEQARRALTDPATCLAVFYAHYVFSRRGRERDNLVACSSAALRKLVEAHGQRVFMEPAEAIWDEFAAVCERRGISTHEEQNRGPIQGMFELAAEIEKAYPGLSLATWILEAVRRAEILEPEHARFVDIRGVGPKAASTFIRDVVVLFGVEENVPPGERIYMLAVNRWLRAILPRITTEPGLENTPDWIVAGKVAKYTRMAGVSACRFDMGVTYFGQRIVGTSGRFEQELEKLAAGSLRLPATEAPKLV